MAKQLRTLLYTTFSHLTKGKSDNWWTLQHSLSPICNGKSSLAPYRRWGQANEKRTISFLILIFVVKSNSNLPIAKVLSSLEISTINNLLTLKADTPLIPLRYKMNNCLPPQMMESTWVSHISLDHIFPKNKKVIYPL